MVQYIFTPWRDQQELLAVRRQLYPNHHGSTTPAAPAAGDDVVARRRRQKQEAVARVSMWMQRGNCPHLVESTALLEAAILSDAQATSEPSLAGSSSSYAVRAAYSAAFSRFVTGLMDSHQDKARKMSMYAVAKSVGLPATFVELRHQATHEQLPSLTRLRAAAEKALGWIYEYYWRHLDEEASTSSSLAAGRGGGGGGGGAGVVERSDSAGKSVSSAKVCRALLMEMFATEDEEREAAVRADLRRRRGREVFEAMAEINQTANSARLLRKTAAFMRELLDSGAHVVPTEEEKQTSMSPVDSQPQRTARDIDAVRNLLQEDRMELEKTLADVRTGEEQEMEQQAQGTVEAGPAWSRYDKRGWIPKPIGVV